MKVDERLIQQLAVRLREAVHETRHIETAQIQIIGLESVKMRAGALWPELSARVRETSADFIDQRLGEHDFVIPAGDGFVVVYAEPGGAPDKCLALQGELNTFYLGDEATKELSATVTHQTHCHQPDGRWVPPRSRTTTTLSPTVRCMARSKGASASPA